MLGRHRSNVDDEPVPDNVENLRLMRLMAEEDRRHPFLGSRRMVLWLATQQAAVNRKRVPRLPQNRGIQGIAPGPKTTVRATGHQVDPYLLRGVELTRPNQVWAGDLTDVPMPRGDPYRTAVRDWFRRCVLSWRLSNRLEVEFCLAARAEALPHGRPEIFNTDPGSQFTSREFTGRLAAAAIAIGRDGKGRAIDTVMIERLWRLRQQQP